METPIYDIHSQIVELYGRGTLTRIIVTYFCFATVNAEHRYPCSLVYLQGEKMYTENKPLKRAVSILAAARDKPYHHPRMPIITVKC